MTKSDEEAKRENYFKKAFESDGSPKDGEELIEVGELKIRRNCVKAALERAHDIRKFEISLYWQRSFFFWGFVVALLAGLGLILTAEHQNLGTRLMACGVSLLSFFITWAWLYIERGSKSHMENWEYHIDFLENDITGRLYKINLGKKNNFFSVSRITRTVIVAFLVFWIGAILFTIMNLTLPFEHIKDQSIFTYLRAFWEKIYSNQYIIENYPILGVIAIISFGLIYKYKIGLDLYWATSDRTIPPEAGFPDEEIELNQRKFPKTKLKKDVDNNAETNFGRAIMPIISTNAKER